MENWRIKELGVQHALKLNSLFIDARSVDEYNINHIPNALLMNSLNWDHALLDFLERWSPERVVVIYCDSRSCGLSKQIAIKLLTDLPEAKIRILSNGFKAWQSYQSESGELVESQ
ncbi:MAG: rhodanese-like domain-containing protein [Opitutus sp.]|nr:rhodanese-like domain-containing protein [Opitutus sp.]